MQSSRRSLIVSIVFFSPALIIMLFFFVMPILSSFYYSLFEWDILSSDSKYVGLQNYIDLFSSRHLLTAVRNTVVYAVLVAFFNNFFGLLLALGLDNNFKTKKVLRTMFFIPSLISLVISGYTWTFLYHPEYGVPKFLSDNFHINIFNQDWLGDPQIVIYSIAFVTIWQYAGYYMVIYLTGLQGVPIDLYEASIIDGANLWRRFWSVTFPMIAPAITVGIVTATIGGLKVFDQVFVMTRGGPGFSSETLTTLLVTQTFFLSKAGYGVTISVILFILVFTFSIFQLNFLRKREDVF